MAREKIDLPIQSYGLFKQRSMLHNCAHMPTLSGNADVQIATVPKVRSVFGWIPAGSAIKQAQQCFGWTIYRVENADKKQEIHLRSAGGKAYSPFAAYEKSAANGYGHFTSAEFVDKDALEWVIVQFNNAAYKIWNDISADSLSINLSGLDFDKSREMLEIFINGSLFESYLSLRKMAELSPPLSITATGSGDLNGGKGAGGSIQPFFSAEASDLGAYAENMMDGLGKLRSFVFANVEGRVLSPQARSYFTDDSSSQIDGYPGMDNRSYIKMYRNFNFFANPHFEALASSWNMLFDGSGYYTGSTGSGGPYTSYMMMAIWKDNPKYGEWGGIWPNGQSTVGVYRAADAERSNRLFRPAFTELSAAARDVREFIETMQADGEADLRIPNSVWVRFEIAYGAFRALMGEIAWICVFDYGTAPYLKYAAGSSFMDGMEQLNIRNLYGDNFSWNPIDFNGVFGYLNRMTYLSDDLLAVYRQFWVSFVYSGVYETLYGLIDSRAEEIQALEEEIMESGLDGKDGAIEALIEAKANLLDIREIISEYIMSLFKDIGRNEAAETLDGRIESLIGWFGYMKEYASRLSISDDLRDFLLAHKSDHGIIWIEQLSHMLFAVASDNRFYYSNPGDTTFESLNFYNAEYANSKVYECWRLANRLVFFTSNTVEFWDITNNFEDPVSPAYSSDVYSIEALRNSIVRFNDVLYFIGKPMEMDSYGVFTVGKNGQLARLSHPQLETWISRQTTNYENVIGSVASSENAPLIMWHLKEHSENLCYNAMFNSFFWNDDLFFLADGKHWRYGGNEIGALDAFNDGEGYSVPCRIATTNTNFGGKQRRIVSLEADVDLEEEKGRANGERFICFKFDRVSKMPWTSMRKVKLQTMQGNRNVRFKVFGVGLGTDFQAEISWNGYLRINRLSLEVE